VRSSTEVNILSESEPKKKEKPVKLEDVAQETGELVGKGIKKTWNIVKSFGRGMGDALEKERTDTANSACPHCGASNPPGSNFCSACGKKL
jgi:ribosomal protein L40E